ncbi:TPA: sulfate adenylyltransferase small subunit, partial [Corynebacterium striatum]|nr:sulfate adenylyltransferase small subunit [Corynebacterium striatum]
RELQLPSIYYSHERELFNRNGMWLCPGEWDGPREGEELKKKTVRYRTVGDMSCTGAVESTASTPEEILAEISVSTLSERGATRADDKLSESAMEDRKKEGYF